MDGLSPAARDVVAGFPEILAFDADIEFEDAVRSLYRDRDAYRVIKRLFDFAFSLIALALSVWLFALIALAVKLDDPSGPVVFRQNRVAGIDPRTGRVRSFRMYKFRTMCADAEERLAELADMNEKTGPVFKIKDDPRVTRVGRLLRKTSLDELPQFWNVIAGDLSLVGPRPALPCEVERYEPAHMRRLAVKPGLTCFWQTSRDRDSLSFEQWVELDVEYVKRCSVATDLKQIVKTVRVMFAAEGH